MTTIPQSIRSLFKSFPIATYPPVTSESGQAFHHRQFTLQPKSSQRNPDNDHFSLGVYGLFESSNGFILATDPECLFSQLQLCHRNDLKIPTISASCDSSDETSHKIMILSYQASKDSQLPILIENSESLGNGSRAKQSSNRTVRSSFALHELALSKITNRSTYLISHWADQVLYDIWTFTLLTELDASQLLNLYSSPTISPASPIVKTDQYYTSNAVSPIHTLVLKDLLVHLLSRYQFRSRYPTIAENFHNYLPNFVVIQGKPAALGSEIEKIFEDFISLLHHLQELGIGSQSILEDDEDKRIIELKIASYLICIKQFMQGTKVYAIVEEGYPELFTWCDLVLQDC
ncbi:SAM complex subunit [Saccharomycopsis crataegensis]|uniref:SAM complex subunit n=1 Tax=Saccharomycopsis crataegensis TaxID=43959 RepID=A0AAV5QRK9_9ASCO|nr:SAM complex subunit [Saccharomycopsis crataegensis]